MFVASRDLRAARGRFALISVVVVLIALLVTFLSGLTAGLRHQNVSVVERIDAESVVFAASEDGPSFDESALTSEQVALWRRSADSVHPIGVGRGSASAQGDATKGVALVGADGARSPTPPSAPTSATPFIAPPAADAEPRPTPIGYTESALRCQTATCSDVSADSSNDGPSSAAAKTTDPASMRFTTDTF